MAIRFTSLSMAALAVLSGYAQAADLPPKVAPAPAAPAACKATLSFPAYNGPIKQNPDPTCFTIGGFGDIYVGGALTGYAYTQTNQFAPGLALPLGIFPDRDRAARVDFSNLMGFVQKADGPFQFYIAAGAYAVPTLGAQNYSAINQTDLLFGPLPVAFGKWQINDAWSIQGGRMPTLIGSEAPFTFQNLNISRGLLFFQENIINHGVQVNWSEGPWSVSVAGTDGFYSGEISWFTGSVAYKLNDANTIGVNGGFNVDRTNAGIKSFRYQFATPLFQQNSGIFNINYTYSDGPWIITPYFQFTNVERDPRIGILESASTYGGAILASYAFNDNFALAGRVEYETQTGNRFTGLTSLLYGPGSSALSVTVTPTFTFGRYFLRGEYAHVQLYDITAGLGFGKAGNKTSQDRYLIETGFTF
ncbi:porin [Methylobacterium sp. WSM2598]|uniref:porin n=1 Tax=Methylobacterium sp. WSM2598 TaxID=398261 RepID=UPI000377895B|nr:porin [Methylobacterium sp. WSM2598]